MIVCNLEKLIKQRDITQVELADKLGVSRNTISNYIHNKSKSFSMEHMDKLIEILHCSFDDLFTYMTKEEYEKYQKEQESTSGYRGMFISRSTNVADYFAGAGGVDICSTDDFNLRLYEYLINQELKTKYSTLSKKSDKSKNKYECKNRLPQDTDYIYEDNVEMFKNENLHDLKHKVDKFSDDIEDLKEQMSNIIKYIEYSNRD